MADSNDSSSTDTSSNGKVVVEDVTAKATEENKKKEKIVNKANNYKEYWKGIQEEEQRMTGDMPDFRIYISYERLNGGDLFGKTITPGKKEEDTDKDKDKNEEES